MQKVLKSSSLYIILSQPPYLNDAHLTYLYINYTMQKTLNLETEEAAFKNKWDQATMLNSVPLTNNAVYKWKDFLVLLNQVPAAYQMSQDDLVKKFTFGIHPKLSGKAMDMYEANLVVNQIPAAYPALIFPGGPAHPNAGAFPPNAGQRDILQYVTPIAARFTHLVEQRKILLQSSVEINAYKNIKTPCSWHLAGSLLFSAQTIRLFIATSPRQLRDENVGPTHRSTLR